MSVAAIGRLADKPLHAMPTYLDARHLAILAALAWLVWRVLRQLGNWLRVDRSHDLAWGPWHLRHAQLAYAEAIFRCREPISLIAKVDRAYRADGLLHLVELKTRARHRIYRYDVIELSAQRIAIQGDTGETVASTAYILTQLPGSQELKRHRVRLMNAEHIVALSHRRLAILNGQAQPCRTRSPALCRKCAYAEPCARLQSVRPTNL